MHQSGSTLRRFLPLCTTLAKLHSCRNPRLVPSAFTSRCSSSSPVMASQSPPRSEKLVLVLCGKSPSEIELAKLLKDSNALKLNDNHTIAVHLLSQSGKPGDDEKLPFDVDSFMAAISTNRFGRLLIWSPRLPSTHDVVSQNFGELPVGSVCVADVQFKGRGEFYDLEVLCTVHLRKIKECVGVTDRLPYVFVYHPDGGWTSSASNTVCSVSCYDRGHKGRMQ
ncbi:hypothetical protein Dimus_025109 [Dionaea muscipula]